MIDCIQLIHLAQSLPGEDIVILAASAKIKMSVSKVSESLVGGVRDLKSRTERHLTEFIAQFSIQTAASERSRHVTKPCSGETLFPI